MIWQQMGKEAYFMLEPLITDSLLLPGGIANKARRQKK